VAKSRSIERGDVAELKGKHLRVLEEYVNSSSLDKWYRNDGDDEPFKQLVATVVGMHGSFLDRGDAIVLIQNGTARFFYENHITSATGSLSDTKNEQLGSAFVAALKREIESYPRQYALCIELPQFPYFGPATFELSPQLQLICGSHQFEPARTHQQMLANAISASNKNCTFLRVHADGFAGSFPDSPAYASCISIVKQCAFVLAAYGTSKRIYREKTARSTFHDAFDGWTLAVPLPGTAARMFAELALDESKLTVVDHSAIQNGRPASLLSAPMRVAESEEEMQSALERNLDCVVKYFAHAGSADFESISAAIEWYQDSLFADNQTFAYLAACIGLEALLGSAGHMDEMTNRLVDRYGFMLGRTRSEREQLSGEYRKALALRGQLVHAKQQRLVGEQKQYLPKVQTMLREVIWHELQNMYRASGPR